LATSSFGANCSTYNFAISEGADADHEVGHDHHFALVGRRLELPALQRISRRDVERDSGRRARAAADGDPAADVRRDFPTAALPF
jgi:hypothetical protein